ncbi:MAG: hypothetical protein Q4A71_03160 [Actinomycetaceae bacterium]|nr:hypothetical protein [Actinomycetaceae bacterium]
MRLKPGLQIIPLRDGKIQVGQSAPVGCVLDELSIPQRNYMCRLGRAPAGYLDLTGMARQEFEELWKLLFDAGLTCSAKDIGEGNADYDWWVRLGGHKDQVKARSEKHVRVQGLAPLGMQIFRNLRSAGFERTVPVDARPVRPADVGPVYSVAELGQSRQLVAGSHLAGRSRKKTDLVVLVDSPANDPATCLSLVSEDIPHLLVTVTDTTVDVGPFVIPGRTACYRCVNLRRTALNSYWPDALAHLLYGRENQVESILLQNAAAFVARQVSDWSAGKPPETANSVWSLSAQSSVPTMQRFGLYPGCGCHGFIDP